MPFSTDWRNRNIKKTKRANVHSSKQKITNLWFCGGSLKIHHPCLLSSPNIIGFFCPLNCGAAQLRLYIASTECKQRTNERDGCCKNNMQNTIQPDAHSTREASLHKNAVIIHHPQKLQSHPGDWPFYHWWYEKTEQAFRMLLCHVQVLHVQEWKYVEDGILNVSWRV